MATERNPSSNAAERDGQVAVASNNSTSRRPLAKPKGSPDTPEIVKPVDNAPVAVGAPQRGENEPQPSNPASGDRGFIADGTNTPIPPQQRTDIDIAYFRNLLFQERANLESERDAIRARGQDMEGALPEDGESGEEDTADLATAIMDKEFDMSVEDEIEESLAQIDRALQKIDEGTYGICDMSGEPIPVARLELIPYATLTAENQALSEGEI